MNAREIYDRLPREGSYLLEDPNLALIEFGGADVLEWLQGQATNDLRDTSSPTSFCLCHPTGQLLALCELHHLDDRIFVLTDNGPAVLERSEQMVILEDVQATDLKLTLAANSDETSRIENGIPKRDVDYTSKTLPPELGPVFEARHISYNKGCYTGQEVLMRMHSRGHTNKTWVGIILNAPVTIGSRVMDENGEDVGVVTSAAVSDRFGPIAAATIKNVAAQEETLVKIGNAAGRVTQMPIRKN